MSVLVITFLSCGCKTLIIFIRWQSKFEQMFLSVSEQTKKKLEVWKNWKWQTYSDEISLDKQLWHGNRIGAETFSDLLLHFPAHEHVSFHELDQMGPQDLSDLEAPLIGVSDYAHCSSIQYNFAGFFFLPRLKYNKKKIFFKINSVGNRVKLKLFGTID